MKKKIILILFFFIFLISCGKKGDPEYKALNQEIKIATIIINKIS